MNTGGKNVSGIIDADNAAEAREKLRAGNLFPTAINEAYERMLKGDVKYRFVMDLAKLDKAA